MPLFEQINHLRLGLKLKTTDWPAAVARDFLLAAANTVPLFIPDGSVVPLESRTVDEDIRVLALLANQIQMSEGKIDKHYVLLHYPINCITIFKSGVFKSAPVAQSSRSPMMPRPPPPNSLALQQQQQQQQAKDWNVGNSAPPPVEPPPPAPPVQAPPVQAPPPVSRPLPPVPARSTVQASAVPSAPPVVPVREAQPSNGISTASQPPQSFNVVRAPPPIPARNLPPVPPRTAK
jgi:hypothetical protein